MSTPGPVMISVTAFGSVPPGRDGAPGRRCAPATASSSPARSATPRSGSTLLQGRLPAAVEAPTSAFLIDRYLVPQPRSALAVAVRDHASAAMDVSDGLAGDLAKLCAASGVSATIDRRRAAVGRRAGRRSPPGRSGSSG